MSRINHAIKPMKPLWSIRVLILPSILVFGALSLPAASLTLSRENNWLVIHGAQIPGEKISINYLEAYCRANSTDADCNKHTVIQHKNEPVSMSVYKTVMKRPDTTKDAPIL